MSFQVNFINVGSGKSNWETSVPNLDYRTLLKEVKKHRAIFSKHPDIEAFSNGTGTIEVGWRKVGEFKWKEVKDEKPKAKTKKAAVPA